MMKTKAPPKLLPFDAARYLDNDEAVAEYMTAAHLVLVWQTRDDPNLLWHAQRAKEVGRNPRVIAYEVGFGPSASYYAWEASGRPVHGVKGK